VPSLTADTIGWLTAARRKWTCRLLRQGISEQCCKPPLAWRSVRSRNFGTQNLIVFGDCIGGHPHNTSTFVRCSVRIDANNDAFFSLRFVFEKRVQLCKRPQMQAASAACPTLLGMCAYVF